MNKKVGLKAIEKKKVSGVAVPHRIKFWKLQHKDKHHAISWTLFKMV